MSGDLWKQAVDELSVYRDVLLKQGYLNQTSVYKANESKHYFRRVRQRLYLQRLAHGSLLKLYAAVGFMQSSFKVVGYVSFNNS